MARFSDPQLMIIAVLTAVTTAVGAPVAAAEAVDTAAALDALAARLSVPVVAELPADPTLDDYAGYALRHNRRLAAAVADWEATAAREDAVAALPDPRLTWTEAIEPVETRLGPQRRVLSLSQQFPWFGTLGLRRSVEEHRAAAARASLAAAADDVLAELRRLHAELGYLARATAVVTDHLELVKRWERSARARYETGAGELAPVLQAQVEIGKLEDRLASLGDRRRPLTARFNALLDRAPDAPVRGGAAASGPVDLGHLADLDVTELRSRLLVRNPELARLASEAQAHVQSARAVARQGYPGFSVGLSYVQIGAAPDPDLPDSGRDAVAATVGLSLPLWRGAYAAAEREAEGRYRATEYRRSDLAARLLADLEQAVFAYDDGRRRLALYENTLLPKAQQSLTALTAAYEADAAGFIEVVDAERILLEFELSGQRAAADILIGRADIERLVGRLDGTARAAVGAGTED